MPINFSKCKKIMMKFIGIGSSQFIPKEHEKAAFEAARKSPGFNERKS
jgi:hypothetical protein